MSETATTSEQPKIVIRSLQKSELENWYDHLAATFSAKGTPREYFIRHVENDPYFDIQGIQVVTENGKIASSCRVFLRKIYIHNKQVVVGGLGEVSTQPQCQGKGYAKLCLQRGIAYMQFMGISLSSLHSSKFDSIKSAFRL